MVSAFSTGHSPMVGGLVDPAKLEMSGVGVSDSPCGAVATDMVMGGLNDDLTSEVCHGTRTAPLFFSPRVRFELKI
jgi:hypothetical protein